MARLNTRASSAAGPDDEEVRHELDQARTQNDLKLKTRLERIFRKYDRNFEGVGDEIDIHSGEIVVNNGHLQNMRGEVDPGRSASSRFVRVFQQSLEHEVDPDDRDGDDDGDEDSEDGDEDSDGEDSQTTDSQSTIEPLRALSRPPPRLAELLVGGTGAVDDDGETSQDVSLAGDMSSTGLLEQVPGLRDSVSALTVRSRRPGEDADIIAVLAADIANRLAQLIPGSTKRRNRKSQPRSRRETIDPVWDYPEINTTHRQKRKRSPSPVVAPPTSSPPAASPGQRSLWAPAGSRPSKRFHQAATPSLRKMRSSIIPSSAVRGSDLKRCMNCSFTNSPTWQTGPGGGDLCASCAKYHEHHGRMKPFDSPTPSIAESDPSSEPGPEIELGEPATAAIPVVEENILMEPPPAQETFVKPPNAVPTLPVERRSPPIPFPKRDQTPEAIVLEPDVSCASLRAGPIPRLSTPAQHIEPVAENRSPFYMSLCTPETYPANTSRQMTSGSTKSGSPFSTEEKALIIKLKEHYDLPWHVVALRFPQRTMFAVQKCYSKTLAKKDCPGRELFNSQLKDQEISHAVVGQSTKSGGESAWSYEQDQLLLKLREEKELGWADIASILTEHSIEAIRTRYAKLVESEQLKREEQLSTSRPLWQWSTYEDALILRLREVDQLPWHQVAERFVNRSMQSIQKHYSRHLAPEKRKRVPSDLTKGTAEEIILEADPDLATHLGVEPARPFDPAEDELIKRLVVPTEKTDWAAVATQLPGRSIRSIYVRYTNYISNELVSPQPKASHPGSPGLEASSAPIPTISYASSQPRNIRRTDTPPRSEGCEAISSGAGESAPVVASRFGPGFRRPFDRSEDEILMQLKASSNASWEEISLRLPGRSAEAISQRFTDLIQTIPEISSTRTSSPSMHQVVSSSQPTTSAATPESRRFTREEDDLVSTLHAQGLSLDEMAPHFHGRASGSLKERWYSQIHLRGRNSLPAAADSRAGLLRTALDNSRRRSDVHAGTRHHMLQSSYGDSDDEANNPIMVDDVSVINAPSKQLFGELHSSVVPEPTHDPRIDPNDLDLDRKSSIAQNFQQLMRAAEQYAAQRGNSSIAERIEEMCHCNANDPRLRKLLELTALGSPHTASEVEWAFEAFELASVQAETEEHNLGAQKGPSASTLEHGRGKGKEKARECALFSAQASMPMDNPAIGQAIASTRPPVQEMNGSVEGVKSPAMAPTKAPEASSKHGHASWSLPAASRVLDSTSVTSQPIIISSDGNCHSGLPTGNPARSATVVAAGNPAAHIPNAGQASSTDTAQHPSDHVSEEVLSEEVLSEEVLSEEVPGDSQRPKHTFHELINMAFACQPKAMHFKTICDWIERNFAYYRTTSTIWRSEILKELNRNSNLEQIETGCVRKWRIKASTQPSQVKRRVGRPRKNAEAVVPSYAVADGDNFVPCSDGNGDEDLDDTEEVIFAKPPPRKRGRPRKQRTTGSVEDSKGEKSVSVTRQPQAGRNLPGDGRLCRPSETVGVRQTAAPSNAAGLDLAIEIADSDGAEELSITPVRDSPPREVSSGKRVRFVETVEVKGPAGDSSADTSPSLKERALDGVESDTREPRGSSSSPPKVQAVIPLENSSVTKAKEVVPSSSPVFMKPYVYGNNITRKPKVTTTPASLLSDQTVAASPIVHASQAKPISASGLYPQSKSRLTQLRRRGISTGTPPRTPKANWPKRHSTPTAFFSHRASPALERGVMQDRFGFGRKRVVETPIRELAQRRDVEEDELA